MLMKKTSGRLLGAMLGIALSASHSYGQEKTSTTTSTTVEQSSTQVQPVTRTKKAKSRSRSGASAATAESISTTTTTVTQVESAPQPMVPRKTYDAETLKKISHTICTEGFKAYIGQDKSNLCMGKASPPDIAYSCVWTKKGTPVYPGTPQGPCNLDYTEHRGSVSVKGTEAQCCFRAASGPAR